MGLAVLIVVGAVLGWLASIVTRIEHAKGIFLNVGIGVGTAVLAGGLANSGSILLGISGLSLFAAFVGAAAVLAIFHILMRGRASE